MKVTAPGVFIAATAVLFGLVWFSSQNIPQPEPPSPPPTAAVAEAPAPVVIQPVIASPPVVEATPQPKPKRVDPEVERMNAIVRAIDERYLESSPAKDTPEAKHIEAMLAVRGIDRVEMPLAYNIAWNYQHALKLGLPPEFARIQVGDFMSRLSRKGPIGEDFWTELFAIKPTVFYGQKDFSMPPEFAQR